MDVKGIIFDFGFTLFYFDDPSVERYYDCFNKGLEKCVELLKEANIIKNDTAAETFLNVFNRERRSALKQSFKTKIEYPTAQIFKTVIEKLFEKRLIEDVNNLNENYYNNLANIYHSVEEEMWFPFEATENTLKELSKLENVKLAVLSNHPHHYSVKNLLRKYDLLKYFDAIITSAKHGKRKPHPDIFYHTLKKMGLHETSSCVMCGDEYADIVGGHRVGLKTILCERVYKFPFEKEIDVPELIKISNISEILKQLL